MSGGQAVVYQLRRAAHKTCAEIRNAFWVNAWECALSANGRYLITLSDKPGTELAVPKVWDTEEGKLVATLEEEVHADRVRGVAISPDGKFALTEGVHGPFDRLEGVEIAPMLVPRNGNIVDIHLWDVPNKKLIKRFRGDEFANLMAFSASGEQFVLGKRWSLWSPNNVEKSSRDLTLWDIEPLQPVSSLANATSEIWPGNLRNVPDSSRWVGLAGSPKKRGGPYAAFWDFASKEGPKIVEVGLPYWTSDSIALSPRADFALVPSRYNHCALDFFPNDPHSRESGGKFVPQPEGRRLLKDRDLGPWNRQSHPGLAGSNTGARPGRI